MSIPSSLYYLLPGGALLLGIVYALSRLAPKLEVGSSGTSWNPLHVLSILCQRGGLSPWYMLAMLVPGAGIGLLLYLIRGGGSSPLLLPMLLLSGAGFAGAGIYFWRRIGSNLGKKPWLFALLGATVIIPLIYLAFTKSKLKTTKAAKFKRVEGHEQPAPPRPVEDPAPPPPPSGPPSVLCIYAVSGEHQGLIVDLPPEGLVFGRDGRKANMVLKAQDVSRKHATITPHPHHLDRAFLKDEGSNFGTFYRIADSPRAPWQEVSHTLVLEPGMEVRFGRGDDIFAMQRQS